MIIGSYCHIKITGCASRCNSSLCTDVGVLQQWIPIELYFLMDFTQSRKIQTEKVWLTMANKYV
jgi:dissimilatory sulfite reductase (desulfoviridin) alpha/beta subunit